MSLYILFMDACLLFVVSDLASQYLAKRLAGKNRNISKVTYFVSGWI